MTGSAQLSRTGASAPSSGASSAQRTSDANAPGRPVTAAVPQSGPQAAAVDTLATTKPARRVFSHGMGRTDNTPQLADNYIKLMPSIPAALQGFMVELIALIRELVGAVIG